MGKKTRIAGWVLSILIAAFMIVASATPKFTGMEGMDKMLAEMGWTAQTMKMVGVFEVAFSLIFILPRIGFWGAILLTAYLGGAVSVHMRIGQPWFFPIIFGVLVWIALGMRQPEIFSLAAGKRLSSNG